METGKVSKSKKKRKWPAVIITVCILLFAGNLLISSKWFRDLSIDRRIPVPDEWNLIVVNRWNEIPEDYSVELTELPNGLKVDSRIYPYLQEMFDAAADDGIYAVVGEAYRTAEEQKKLFDDKILAFMVEGFSRKKAEEMAKEWVAVPGTSEHQLGIAVDINADKTLSDNEDVYQWLADNAYKYGFILRYPQWKTEITGNAYEPWHYRYVGEKAALEIYEQNICLEEYLT